MDDELMDAENMMNAKKLDIIILASDWKIKEYTHMRMKKKKT